MKCLFINPRRSIERKNIWSVVNSITPPLGLAALSSVLEEHGFVSDIIDAEALDLSVSEILDRIDQTIDIVGLTATTPEIDSVIVLARTIRERFPRITILFGGVHATIFHEALVADGIGDMVVRGEGEAAILAIAQQQLRETIPNLTWRASDGHVVVNPQGSAYVDLNTVPFPAYHKLPMNRYHSALGAAKRSPSIGIITSRGCPGTCTFCYSGMFGSRIRFMSAERVLELILLLKQRYGIREVSFYDDTFTASRKRIEALCGLLIVQKVNISWSCFARVDTVDLDLLTLMKKAGCHQVGFGFESADEGILKTINKRFNTSRVLQAVSWMKTAGMDIRGAFMIGNIGETEDSIKRTIAYSNNLGIQYAIYNITTPFPGTELYRDAQERSLVKHTQWSLYDLSHAILELPTVSSEMVQQYYHKAYRAFYLRPVYILRRVLSIRTKDDFMTYWSAFTGILSMIMNRHEKAPHGQ
jgi:anaerobic magnesium-protoporphyrin IX monomethyl ester cyclase